MEIESTFEDGTKMVTASVPIRRAPTRGSGAAPDAEGWSGSAVSGGHRALGSVFVVDPAWKEVSGEERSAAPPEGSAALMPLTGAAAVLGTLGPDTVELRRRPETKMTLLNGEGRPVETAWTGAGAGN